MGTGPASALTDCPLADAGQSGEARASIALRTQSIQKRAEPGHLLSVRSLLFQQGWLEDDIVWPDVCDAKLIQGGLTMIKAEYRIGCPVLQFGTPITVDVAHHQPDLVLRIRGDIYAFRDDLANKLMIVFTMGFFVR